MQKKTLKIQSLEKRLMLDASLGALNTTTVLAENTVNAGPVILDGDVTISGSTTNFNGESLTISTDGGGDDQISINNEGTGAGQIGFDGTNVSYEGTVIGTISSDGSNGSALIIDFDADATKTGIERLIENITYANASDDPVTSRTLNYALGVLFSENMDVVIVADNEGPSIDMNAGINLNEGDTLAITSSELGISDPDHAATAVTITVTNNVDNGRLELSSNPGVSINSFTLDQLNNGLVRYVHNGGETTSDQFQFTVTDGDITTGTQNFNITVNAVDDPMTLDTNTGTTVSAGFEIGIGGREVPAQWGSHVRTMGEGEHSTFSGQINGGVNTQMRILFTTDSVNAGGTPGEVLFETGGSGRGVALVLDNDNKLAWYSGPATGTPRMISPISLDTSTQYAAVVEIDFDTNEIRMHYAQAGDFNWFEFGRTAETSMAWTDTNLSGGNGTGIGDTGNNSIGGYNGARSANEFRGSIDSDLILTRFPSGGTTTIVNDQLVAADVDTTASNLVYTITNDVDHGTLKRSGVDLGLGDTFTQEDLNNGLITYLNDGTANPADSFEFSLSDGTTTLTAQTYNITVDITNTAPVIAAQSFDIAENTPNGSSVGTLEVFDPEVAFGQTLTYSITGGTGAGVFTIDSATGQITVIDSASLDYEIVTSFTLDIEVMDDAPTPGVGTRTITINLQDVNENQAPVIAAGGPYSVNENASVGDSIATVSAVDAEGDNITYSITNGNGDNIFKINATTGEITINSTANLNYERDNSYTIRIRALDDNSLPLYSERNFVINIGDINEAPTLNIEQIIEEQNPGVFYSADTGNFYQYVDSNVKYWTAEANAASATLNGANGHLLTITSVEENNFVRSIMGNHIWLAASDIDSEGQWIWRVGPEGGVQFSEGGTSVNGMYNNWNGTEPNTANYDRAYMNTNGRWYDDDNNQNRRYVIEWEGNEVINNSTYNISHDNPDGSDLTVGHSVGTLQGYDPEGDTIEYSIQGGNNDNIFAIDINTGEITIADTTNLDASVTDSYTLTIRVQEQGSGLFSDKDIVINFDNNFNVTQNNDATVSENGSVIIDNTNLQVTDADTAADEIVYRITGSPANGQLELTTSPGALITSFTQDDIDNNRLRYVHDGSETLSDSFTFSISDGTQTLPGQSFDIVVNPINQGPSIDVNTGTNVDEGGNVTITSAMLDGSDSDDADTDITYTASNLSNGHIEVNGVIGNVFTQDDINNNRVVFVHDGSESNASFDISLADGGEDGSAADTGTFTLTRNALNDGPQITTNNPATVLEGGQVTITTADLNGTDPDDGAAGLTYTLSNITNGFVVLSTNPAVPILSFTQDDLNNNRVIFKHGGGENNGSFDISLADGGEDGATADTATFVINRTPVNDAPDILVNAGSSVNQNSVVLIKSAVLAANDPDDSGVGLTYTVTGTLNGQIEFVSNPGVAINSFTQDDINNSRILFRHSGPPGVASFDFTLADGGEDGAGVVNDTFNFTVDNSNDAPTITTLSTPTFDEGSTSVITTAMLDSFDPDDFGADLTWTASNLSNGIIQVNGITGNVFTQADLDNGLVTFIHDGSETVTAGFDIQVADGGEDGALPDTGTLNININPVNEAVTITTNTGATVAEGDNVTITNAMLNFSDVDDTATGVTYTASNYDSGHIEVNGVIGNVFTQDDINNNRVVFVHDGSEGAAASFDISLADGGEDGVSPDTGTFNLNVTAVNDSPIIGVNNGATVDEAGSVTITTAMLNEADPDDDPAGLTYTASNLSNGHIEVNGVIGNVFTQADIDNNLVVFVHDGSETVAASFDIALTDGGEDASVAANGTFNITVNPTNDSPDMAVNNGATVLEGGQVTLNNTMLSATDIESADAGLIYTITSLPPGVMENTNTASVLGIGDTFTQGDINNGFIRYTHDGGENTTEALAFTIGDGTDTTAHSFSFNVTPVNDTPTAINMSGGSIAENSAQGSVVATLTTLDVDPGDSFTYEIMGGDPDGLFAINGNQIVVNGLIDFELIKDFMLDIRVTDSGGASFQRDMGIEIIDIDETQGDPFVPPPERESTSGGTAEEERLTGREEDLLLYHADDVLRLEERYGGQILREYTTLEMHGKLHKNLPGFIGSFVGTYDNPNSEAENFTPQNSALSQESFTTIRQALEFLQSMDSNEQQAAENNNSDDPSIIAKNAIEQQFQDILTYQQQKQNQLRAALLD